MITPNQYQHILGKHFVTHVRRPIFSFNGVNYDRYDLAQMGVPHVSAAKTLDKIVRRLSITTPQQLARRVHELPNIKGAGETVMLVALAICQTGKVAQEAVTTWNAEAVRVSSREGEPRLPVTFATIKRRTTHKRKSRKPKVA